MTEIMDKRDVKDKDAISLCNERGSIIKDPTINNIPSL
jgi:hypothetical protein